MKEQYADSDSRSKADGAFGIRIAIQNLANVHEMSDESPKEPAPDDPVTEFIRLLIDRWEKSGRKLKDLAADAGLAKSMPSQIKGRTSAASFYSATKFAKAFGFQDLPALVIAAWGWWHSADRTQLPEAHAVDPQQDALRIIHGYGVTPAQAARVLERYPRDEYGHKDTLWWLAKFHEARSDDADVEATARGQKSDESAKRRVQKKGQAAIREAKEQLTATVTDKRPANRPAKAG